MGPEDDRGAVAGQWVGLTAALARPHSAILYHLHNHYSLIYAAREWHADAGGSACAVVLNPQGFWFCLSLLSMAAQRRLAPDVYHHVWADQQGVIQGLGLKP